jgi:hypothetical protein
MAVGKEEKIEGQMKAKESKWKQRICLWEANRRHRGRKNLGKP